MNTADIIVLIDDLRTEEWIDSRYGARPTHVARDYVTGAGMLLAVPHVDLLYLDHDLGEDRNGYQLLTWALERGIRPQTVVIVSSNPVGRENIARSLDAEGYIKRGPCWVDMRS